MKYLHFKGDLSGAIANTIVVIPMAIGYGVIALAPLGPTYASRGALMGVYAAIFCAFFAALVGRTPVQMTGPKAPLALVIASLVAGLVVSQHLPDSLASKPLVVISLVSTCVLIGGIFQFLFAAMRLGNLVKYIPSPVVAGFMNGVALLLIIKQIKPLLGLSSKMTYLEILAHPQSVRPLSVIVGVVTFATLFFARARTKKIPAPFAAFAVGIVVYYVLQFVTNANTLGPVIGKIPSALPKPDAFIQLFKAWGDIHLLPLVPTLILTGFFLGILSSMDSLLSSVVGSNLTGVRTNTKKELMGQAAGNIVCSFFGGLPGAGSVPGVMTTYTAGGRTAAAGMISGVTVLVVIVVLGPLVGKIPLAVIAGIIIAVAVMMIDKRTLAMLRAPRRQLIQRQGISIDLAVNLIVAIITVCVNLLIAVGIGVVLASALFIYKMGRSVIHRKYTGENVHSKKVRNLAHQDALEKLGKQIVVFELKGPIFFGSADNLSMEIENSMQDANYCILDMRRVSEIDSTGANILVQTHKMLAKEGKTLLMTYLKDNKALWTFIEALNVPEILTEKQFFQDTDEALEAVEDLVLTRAGQLSLDQTGISLAQMDLVNGFSPDELDLLNAKLVSHRVSKGHSVLKEGEKSRDVYLLVKGSVSVRIRLSDSDRLKRLVSYSPGVMFGEMALLDGNPRSASVVADENTEVMKLSYDDFESLLREHPQVAAKLTQNIALVLAKRLRKLSDEIKMMELEAN